jgi:DNA-binding beta-propeller fold protein YncE
LYSRSRIAKQMQFIQKHTRILSSSKPVQKLVCCLLFCLGMAFELHASDSLVSVAAARPQLQASGNCVGAELIAKNIGEGFQYLVWKANETEVSRAYAPSRMQTVAGGADGRGAADFSYPAGIAVDQAGNIYIADEFNHRVQRWVPGAAEGVTVAGGHGQGTAANQLNHPMGVAVDAAGNLYIADYYNHRIQRWAPGAQEGVTVAGGNDAGDLANQLKYPTAVQLAADGSLYIADAANDRIQQWIPGAKAGITVAGGNGRGSASNQLYFPTGIVLDAKGGLYIADITNQRVQYWPAGAKEAITVVGGKGQGSSQEQFNYPFGLAMNQRDELFVTDEYNHRVQRFASVYQVVAMEFGFKAQRAGRYVAELVYQNGSRITSNPVDIAALPQPDPIVGDAQVCNGAVISYQENQAGSWFSSDSSLAVIDQFGQMMPLRAGTVDISFRMTNEAGCSAVVSKTVVIKPLPAINNILTQTVLAKEVQGAAGEGAFDGITLCQLSRLSLGQQSGDGLWRIQDSGLLLIQNGELVAQQTGETVLQYVVQQDGCEARAALPVRILPLPALPVIGGLNKVVTGQTINLQASVANGSWALQDEQGIAQVLYTIAEKGCSNTASLPLLVQPPAPVVRDAVYQSAQQPREIAVSAQVSARAGNSLVFYASGLANAAVISEKVLNQPGEQTLWVSQVENGISSPRAPFKVTILAGSSFVHGIPVNTQEGGLRLTVLGNPVTQYFSIRTSSASSAAIQCRVMDANGRILEQQTITPGSTCQFGQQYGAGTYYAEFIQQGSRQVLPLIKLGGSGHATTSRATVASIPL